MSNPHCAGQKIGILLPTLSWPTVRINCSNDGEKFLKFEAEGREFAKVLRSLEQVVGTVNFCLQNAFLTCFLDIIN